jgi:hypothetical protein
LVSIFQTIGLEVIWKIQLFMMSFSRVLPPVATDSISNGNTVLIFVAIFLPIQLLFVLLRYYCRWTSGLSWGLDDFLVGLTAIGQIVATSLIIGKHPLKLTFLKSVT